MESKKWSKIGKFFISFTLILFSSFIILSYFHPIEVRAEYSLQSNASGQDHSGRAKWSETEDSWYARLNEGKGNGTQRIFMHRVKFNEPRLRKVSSEPFRFNNLDKYDRVNVEGTEVWDGKPGAPLVPVKPLHILIPYQHQVTKVKVFKGPCTNIKGEYFLDPVQEPLPMGEKNSVKPTFPDPEIYESENAYPLFPCGDAFIQYKRGYAILILNLFPIKYHPLKRKMAYFPEIKIQIETMRWEEITGNKRHSNRIPIRADCEYADEISSLVENPEVLGTYLEDSASQTQVIPNNEEAAFPQGSYDYIIITNNAMRDAYAEFTFQDLIATKMSRGVSATIVTVEDNIYPYYSGTENGDNADKIRHFITDAYVNWGTRWVLLGGDIEVIPKRGVYVTYNSYTQSSLPTDLYYACLDGPWNNDGDNLWGEYNDGAHGGDIDLSAEVYIGRAPVSDATELSNFVAKTIQYETLPHPNEKTAIWLGEKLDDRTWGSASSIAIKDQCLPNDWNIVERYDSTGGWSGSTFINDLNASPHIIEHSGHTTATSNARINCSQVALLTNEYPYIMYSQGCNSGSFDTHDRAIAEQHLVSPNGAVAVVMNARYGWFSSGNAPTYSHHYACEFWDAVFNEKKIHFGETNHDSREDNLFRVGSTGIYRWIHFEVNLFGDPETSFHMPSPTPPSKICGMVVDDVNDNCAQDVNEYGVEGELLFLDKNNNGILDIQEPYVSTGNDGRFTFDNLTPGTYYVRHITTSGWAHTCPVDGFYMVSVGENETIDHINFFMTYSLPEPPASPIELTATAISDHQIDLTWQDNSDNEIWFKIERSLDGVSFSQIAQIGENITKYSDSGLQPNTRYDYRIFASNDGGDSSYSNIATATTSSAEISISYVKPNSGNPGDMVRIGGSNFGAIDLYSRVSFSGAGSSKDAEILLWNDSLIKCKVPPLPAGPYVLNVIAGIGGNAGFPFTILSSSQLPAPPPDSTIKIDKLSVSEGMPGTSLRISGSNFGSYDTSSSKVYFWGNGGDAQAPISLWKDGFVKCEVPQLPAGIYSIKVIKDSNESNIVDFYIL